MDAANLMSAKWQLFSVQPRIKSQLHSFLVGVSENDRVFVPNYASHSYQLTEANRLSVPDSSLMIDHLHDDVFICSPVCVFPLACVSLSPPQTLSVCRLMPLDLALVLFSQSKDKANINVWHKVDSSRRTTRLLS